MRRHKCQRLLQQRFAWLHSMPGRRARRMGQGNDIHGMAMKCSADLFADDIGELFNVGQHLRDGEFADGQ